MALAERERRIDRLERHLELGQDEIAGLEILAGALNIRWRQIAVRALDDEDAIVARSVYQNGRRAGRLAGHAIDVVRADDGGLEIAQDSVAEHVVADLGHHDDGSAELRSRDRLVGALAAMAHLEPRRGDRLAPDGHAVDIGHEVDVARADDADARSSPLLSGEG